MNKMEKLRSNLGEEIQYFRIKERKNPDLLLINVDGYYWVKDAENPSLSKSVRQIRQYEAVNEQDAVNQAKENGLAHGILVETPLGEPQPCILGAMKEGFSKLPNITFPDIKEGWGKY